MTDYTVKEIAEISKRVRDWFINKHAMPNFAYVNKGSGELWMKDYLYLACKATLKMPENATIPVTKVYGDPGKQEDNTVQGNVYRKEYLDLAQRIVYYYDKYGKAPGWAVNTSLGSTMSFHNLVYMFSMILGYWYESGKIPGFAQMTLFSRPPTTKPTPPAPVGSTLDGSTLEGCLNTTLQLGSNGGCVKILQQKLQEFGFYSGKIDGDFGPLTRGSVISFQAATGHSQDGVCGPKTWSSVPNYKSTGSAYLIATRNCQVNDPQIQNLAHSLGGAVAIFNYVRDAIEYLFYYNTRLGALGTLRDKQGNCTDLSHLLVALLRAVGIPARYVNCSAVAFSKITTGHVWVEAYVGGAWVRLDASNNGNQYGLNPRDSQIVGTVTRYAELPF